MKDLYITPATCLGDKWHNEAIATIDAASGKYSAKVKRSLAAMLQEQTQRNNERLVSLGCEPRSVQWCELEKQEALRIYALANSKTEKTFQKRKAALVQWLTNKEHYGALFNKAKIDLINNL